MRTLCLGEALVDLICERPAASLQEADAFMPHFGGATANVAVVAARHGGEVALASGVGDDAWGAWLRQRLRAEGVDLEFFELLPGQLTPVAFVSVDAGGEPSFLIHGDAIGAAIRALAPRLGEAVEACDALFFASNTLVGEDERAATLAARERALELGRPVVFDPNLRIERWGSAAAAADVARACVPAAFLVKLNRAEAEMLTGVPEPGDAAGALLDLGADHVVVTLGADGALLRGGGLDAAVPGVAARPVNTTGAGDNLLGVLIAALGQADFAPRALADALPAAVEAAARATERWGAVA